MTALEKTLRERVSRRGRNAQTDCGALGILTVEALTPRDCAALAGKDRRALLYAACRELQQAGESLRREGLLYTPEEITQYVTDREAEAAAQMVLELSGLSSSPEESEGPESPEVPAAPEEPEEPEEQEEPEKPETAESVAAPLGRRASLSEWQEPEKGAEGKRRLEVVQNFEKKFPEVRLETVRQTETEERREPVLPQDSRKEKGKIRLDGVQNKDIVKRRKCRKKEKKPLDKESDGQASYEFSETEKAEAEEALIPAGTQNLVKGTQIRRQDIAVRRTEREKTELPEAGARDKKRELLHEIKSESREVVHERKSESAMLNVHIPHENKSEFQETAHERKSESGGDFVEIRRETETDMERIARMLLEGLRQAAGAR